MHTLKWPRRIEEDEKLNSNSEPTETDEENVQKPTCDICKKEFDSANDMMLHTSMEHLAETLQFAKNNVL